MVDLANDFYIARFVLEEDQRWALEGGPWIIQGHYLTLREWVPNFNPSEASIDRAAVWVRIPNLPMELQNDIVLRRIGFGLGRTLKIDRNTMNSVRGNFARICVEVDLDKPLKPAVEVASRRCKVEYEAINLICFKCGRIGHGKESCGFVVQGKEASPPKPQEGKSANDGQQGEVGKAESESAAAQQREAVRRESAEAAATSGGAEIFGPWMQAPRKGRKLRDPNKITAIGKGKQAVNQLGDGRGISRFDCLREVDDLDKTATDEVCGNSLGAREAESQGHAAEGRPLIFRAMPNKKPTLARDDHRPNKDGTQRNSKGPGSGPKTGPQRTVEPGVSFSLGMDNRTTAPNTWKFTNQQGTQLSVPGNVSPVETEAFTATEIAILPQQEERRNLREEMNLDPEPDPKEVVGMTEEVNTLHHRSLSQNMVDTGMVMVGGDFSQTLAEDGAMEEGDSMTQTENSA